jgi:hypothetical protein
LFGGGVGNRADGHIGGGKPADVEPRADDRCCAQRARWSRTANRRSLRSAAARSCRLKNSTISSGESDMTLPVEPPRHPNRLG